MNLTLNERNNSHNESTTRLGQSISNVDPRRTSKKCRPRHKLHRRWVHIINGTETRNKLQNKWDEQWKDIDFWGKYCISCKKKGYVVDTCCFIYGFPKGYPLHGRKFNNKKKKEFSQKTNTDKGKIYLRIRVRVRSTFLHQKAKEGYRIEMRRKTRTWW